jgi:hypothetical protein
MLAGIGSFAKDIREAITGEAILDPNKRAELLHQAAVLEAGSEKALLDYKLKMSQAQTAINEKEAMNPSVFVSGWRPAVGWVCVSGLFYTFLAKPILPWVCALWAASWGYESIVTPLPSIPISDLIMLLGGMLGLGTLRTAEKLKGVARK